MRPIMIGLSVSTAATPGADPVAAARGAEALGFDFVSASDHLHGRQPTFEPWTRAREVPLPTLVTEQSATVPPRFRVCRRSPV